MVLCSVVLCSVVCGYCPSEESGKGNDFDTSKVYYPRCNRHGTVMVKIDLGLLGSSLQPVD